MARDRRPAGHPHAASGGLATTNEQPPDYQPAAEMRRLLRSWRHRFAVSGHSMEPTLRDGDWLLVDPDAAPRVGELVVAKDQRAPQRLIVKRSVEIRPGGLLVAGDHPAHAGEAADIGVLDTALVVGRPWLRYWPPRRFGRVG